MSGLTEEEEEEGLQGVFKRLRRNRHQLEKGCCEQLSSDCHSKGGLTSSTKAGRKKKRGYRVCSSGYAATDSS
jgi:hypothetical protein